MDDVDSSSSASEQEEDEGWNGQGKGDASRNATSYLDANSTEPQGASSPNDNLGNTLNPKLWQLNPSMYRYRNRCSIANEDRHVLV